MLNLKKITTTVSLLSLGALSVALFSTGCDNGTSSNGTGGAGGKSSNGGAGGTATGGAAGGHGGSATGGAAGGHGGSATGGAAGGAGGTATGGAGGTATGGAGGAATGGAAGGHGGSATGGSAGSAAGGHAGSAAGGNGGGSAGNNGQASIIYNVTLTGAMEVLPAGTAASTATGAATVTLNQSTKMVSVQGSFTGLSSAATAAHIHGPAGPGAVADAIVLLTATPATAGAISGSGTLTGEQMAAMKNGMTYINVHSSAPYAGGEIRGQIQ